ncbi:MAG: flagellar motor switch protein FliN [Treponema sp.]|nr:flagellar motor switch protein FliN [Treponema sp.]
MSDVSGTISQDEIDALLGGVGIPVSDVAIDVGTLQTFYDGMKDKVLANLNGLSSQNFEISAIVVESLKRDQLLSRLSVDVVSVYVDFNAGATGSHSFFIAPDSAAKIAGADSYNDDVSGMFQELINGISGAEITSIGAKLPGLAADPASISNGPSATANIPDGVFALTTYTFTLGTETFNLYEVLSANAANAIADALGGGSKQDAPAQQPVQQPVMNQGVQMQMGQPMMNPMQMGGMQMGGMQMGGMPMGGMNPMMGMGTPNVQTVQYPNLMGNAAVGEQGNIGLIMDVFMEMTVELGRAKKQIKDILGMGEGTIIELDKLAGEPVDILVNHKPIAKGEVVVIDENFGVRVTEILAQGERVSDMH